MFRMVSIYVNTKIKLRNMEEYSLRTIKKEDSGMPEVQIAGNQASALGKLSLSVCPVLVPLIQAVFENRI